MLEFLRAQLEQLRQKRAALKADLEGVVDAAKRASRGLTDEEKTKLSAGTAELRKMDDDISGAATQIRELEEAEQREEAAAKARAEGGQGGQDRRGAGGARVTSEPLTYGRQSYRHSYFLDLARDQLGRGDGDGGVQEARERLRRHAKELSVEMPAREARREAAAMRALEGIDDLKPEQRASVFERGGQVEKRVNPNRTDGQGGYFVPPLWLVDQYIDLPRFGRQALNLCRNLPLPPGTDSINLPKVNTGTATAPQTADGAAVHKQDMTDTFVSAPVRTIAGQQDLALQLLDQSPIAFDEVIYEDLIADYNARIDIQGLDGSGAAGQHLGILNVGGINAITYTDATPTFPEMYPTFSQGAAKVYAGRKLPATAALVLPGIWYWATAAMGTDQRPLIVPPQYAMNASGTQMGVAGGEGPAGVLSMGLPAYLDGNLPTNKGAGTNETRTIIARWQDLFLFEGALQTRVLAEVLSGNLEVRFQVYAYSAFMPNRRPTSISVVSGTGMIPDANYV
ncbi:phage major capsid protein [Micromonospora sp. CPCC 205371]|nr:phage major capsid protein [Micromonospora sp. CPCC 205371]